MKNTVKVFGTRSFRLCAAVAAATALALSACSDPMPMPSPLPSPLAYGGSGTCTLTGIPVAYNGKYAMLTVDQVIGAQSVNIPTVTLVQIANQRVTLPLWVKTQSDGIKRYYGQRLYNNVTVGIYNSAVVNESDTPTTARHFYDIRLSSNDTTYWDNGY